MIRGDQELLVVGDRVLIRLEEEEERTEVGLYLPPTALGKENVQGGVVEEVGPGIPLPPKYDDEDVPWKEGEQVQMRYIPLQVKPGDRAIFMRKEAVEVKFDKEKFVVVPHAAILVVVRSMAAPLHDLDDLNLDEPEN